MFNFHIGNRMQYFQFHFHKWKNISIYMYTCQREEVRTDFAPAELEVQNCILLVTKAVMHVCIHTCMYARIHVCIRTYTYKLLF